MDIRGLVRDANRVKTSLYETDEEALVTKTGCKIYIPVRFSERSLAHVGVETSIVGIYAIVVEDKYFSTSIVNAMVKITPSATNTVVIEGDDYYEFIFDAGSVVIPSLQLIKSGTLVYRIYDEFIGKGRVPWYMSYDLMARIFDSSLYHAGVNIGSDREVTELLTSIITRDSEDRTMYYRQGLANGHTTPPVFIPIKSVAYSATNTLNKLAGSYMQDGIISALVNPSERTERIENLLRQ